MPTPGKPPLQPSTVYKASDNSKTKGASPAATPSPKTKGRTRKKNNQPMILLIGASVTALLLVIVLLAALIPLYLQKEEEPAPSSSMSTPESLVKESGYDKNANALPTAQLQSTILQQTEDAGTKYVEETLFLGDSNTVRMLSYRDVTNVSLSNGIGVEGMGIQAFNSLQCVQFKGNSRIVTMPEAVAILQPRRIVITFGTNNAGGMGVSGFISSYEKALDTLAEKYPYADIIIGAVPPVDQYHMNESITMTTIDKFNLALAELAEKKKVKFLNWSEALKDSSTGFCKKDYTIQDGIHLSRSGMEAIFTYFRTHSSIGEDRRPTPLKPIPERVGYNPNIINADPTKRDGPLSSSSSSQSQPVTVLFSASEGGTISVNGSSGALVTLQMAPGDTCPTATATPAEGYTFAGWSCSVGSIANPSSTTLSGFQVFSTVKSGETVTVTAQFKALPASSSSAVPIPVSSSASSSSEIPASSSSASSETTISSSSSQQEPASVAPTPSAPSVAPTPPVPSAAGEAGSVA